MIEAESVEENYRRTGTYLLSDHAARLSGGSGDADHAHSRGDDSANH